MIEDIGLTFRQRNPGERFCLTCLFSMNIQWLLEDLCHRNSSFYFMSGLACLVLFQKTDIHDLPAHLEIMFRTSI